MNALVPMPKLPRCPHCGSEWSSRRTEVNANATLIYNRYTRQAKGYTRGTATARLELGCQKGHALTLNLRGVYKGAELVGWQVVP